MKSSYLIYQGVIPTLSPDSANLFLTLLLALLCIFKDDKLKKFIFQTWRKSGHLHFVDLLFMSTYFYKVILLITYSLFAGAFSVFPGLKMSLPILSASTPPPTMLPGCELLAEALRPSSSSFHTQQGAVRRLAPPCNLWSEPSFALSLTTHPFQPQDNSR